MGNVAQPFAVDINKVREVLGSGNLSILDQIKESDFYETYADQSEANFDELLTDLIVRYVKPDRRKERTGLFGLWGNKQTSGLKPDAGSDYGYALLVICGTIGTPLASGGDEYYSGSNWQQVNKIFRENGMTLDLDRMWQAEKLFDIPEIEDFPVISHYSRTEINYLLHSISGIGITQDNAGDCDPDEVKDLIDAFRRDLGICRDKNVDWVAFMH